MQDLKEKIQVRFWSLRLFCLGFFFFIYAERSRCSLMARLKKGGKNQMHWYLTSRKILLILFLFFLLPSLTDVYATRWADSSLFLAFKQGQKLKGHLCFWVFIPLLIFKSCLACVCECICVRVLKERLMYCLMFWLMDAPPPTLQRRRISSERVSIDHGRKKYNNLA